MNKFKTITLAATLVGVVMMGLPIAFAESVKANGSANIKAEFKRMPEKQAVAVHIERSGEIKLVGKITAINGTNLSVQSWGGIWTVDASNAKFTRRSNGSSHMSEMQVGHEVVVHGQASQTNLTVIAKTIHNESIQVRNADFFGKISNLSLGTNASSTATFTLTTEKEGTLKVTIDATTKLMINSATSTTVSGLANGMYARVLGVWDRTNSTVLATSVNAKTEVAIVNEVKPSFFKKIFKIFDRGNHKDNEDREQED